MRWGKDNEARARIAYVKLKKARGVSITVRNSGLHICLTASYLAASSDGIVTKRLKNTTDIECLEIKCPVSVEKVSVTNLTPEEIAERHPKKFCLHQHAHGQLCLPKSHHYYAQVQGELAILGLRWCDFVVYTPAGKKH